MKRRLFTLIVVLAASIFLTGCGGEKPAPSLESDNRNERLQAVRRAQEKWGGIKSEKTADQQAIVGRWNHPWFDSCYYRFNADGTFTKASALGSIDGTYRLLSNDVIEIDQGFGRWELKCRVVGDRLEITDGALVTYQRVAE